MQVHQRRLGVRCYRSNVLEKRRSGPKSNPATITSPEILALPLSSRISGRQAGLGARSFCVTPGPDMAGSTAMSQLETVALDFGIARPAGRRHQPSRQLCLDCGACCSHFRAVLCRGTG